MAIYPLDELLSQLQNRLSDASSDYWTEDTIFLAQLDLAESILPIVQSGNFSNNYAFIENISTPQINVERGVKFSTGEIQTVPFKGVSNLEHNSLNGLLVNDHHQYATVSGFFAEGNIGTNGYINSGFSNGDGLGITFRNDGEYERFVIGANTSIKFDNDNYELTSAKGIANAFISFDATTDPITVNSSYNISTIQHVSKGKFVLYFTNELSDANYAAVTNSNGTDTEDIFLSKSACVLRRKDRCGFVVQNKFNQYINSKTNDIVILSTS